MSSLAEYQAADVRGPETGKIAVLSVTTSSSSTDLSAAAQLGDVVDRGPFVRIVSDVGIYYKWDTSSGTADDTATTGDDRVTYLPASTVMEERPAGKFFTAKAEAAGKVRISLASRR